MQRPRKRAAGRRRTSSPACPAPAWGDARAAACKMSRCACAKNSPNTLQRQAGSVTQSQEALRLYWRAGYPPTGTPPPWASGRRSLEMEPKSALWYAVDANATCPQHHWHPRQRTRSNSAHWQEASKSQMPLRTPVLSHAHGSHAHTLTRAFSIDCHWHWPAMRESRMERRNCSRRRALKAPSPQLQGQPVCSSPG